MTVNLIFEGRPVGVQRARERFAFRPGDQQPDRQCPLLFAARQHRAGDLPAVEGRHRDRRRRRRARRRAGRDRRRCSNASIPTGRIRASASIPASASPSPSRSSRRTTAASGWKIALPTRTAGRTAGRARGALHRAAAGDVMPESSRIRQLLVAAVGHERARRHRARLRRPDRRPRRAHPRPVGVRQVAAGALAPAGGAIRAASVRPPRGRRSPAPGSASRAADRAAARRARGPDRGSRPGNPAALPTSRWRLSGWWSISPSTDTERLPAQREARRSFPVSGLPRLAVASEPLPAILAVLRTAAA